MLVDTILYNKAFTVLEIKNDIAKIEIEKTKKIVFRNLKETRTKKKEKYFNLFNQKFYIKYLFEI